jgi:hypothetical protein
MLGRAEVFQQRLIALIKVSKGIVDNLPVHQVLRVEDGEARHTLKRRSGHIIIFATGTHTDVWIRVVCINHRVRVGTIAIIWAPY